MGLADSNIFSKIALVVLPVGGLFIVIGLASNNWYAYDLSKFGSDYKASSGLWKGCVPNKCATLTEELVLDYIKATRAFVILALLFVVAGTCVFLLSIIKHDVKALKMAALFLPFVAALCTFIGVGVYGGKYLDDTATTPQVREVIALSWSFALTAVGGVICVIAGVLWIVSIVV